MYYCFFCGGKLPDSLRGKLFSELDKSELDEVRALTDKIDSVEKIHEVLGEPDEIFTNDPEKDDCFNVLRPSNKCIRWYVYRNRWKSLELQIHEHEDGTLGFSFFGKYIGREES